MSKGKIKSPVTGGTARVPMVMQMEALECGAASLAMVLAYYDKWIPLEQVRLDCGVSRDGSNARNLARAAQSYGLEVRAYRLEPEELRETGEYPCIIHWNFNHFVVLDGFRGRYAVINDPARGLCRVSMEEFDSSFTGIVICFRPGADFVPGGRPRSMLRYAAERLKGAGSAVVFAALTTVISALLGVIKPGFSRVFIDRLLSGRNPEWSVPFLIFLSAISIIELTAQWIQSVNTLRINGKLASVGATAFLWKVLHLPMEFFSQRMAGDIQGRQASNATIANQLVNTLSPLVLDTFMMFFYLVVMLRYSVLLTMVGVASVFFSIIISGVISGKRVNITRVQMRDAGKLAGATVSGIEMIETIKAGGAENGFFERWAGYQASVNTQRVRFLRLNQVLGMLPELFSSLANCVVLLLGVMLSVSGRFTEGMIMAFQGFLTSFAGPASSLISAGQVIQEMRTDMERIEDVMKYPSDANAEEDLLDPDATYGKLSGALEMRNVTFGYSSLAEPLIRDFSLTLKPGSRVALVGASGCGKSTLSKLISGLYQPWSGEILFDGRPVSAIDRSVFTGSLAVVDQDIILFEDTIANNIRMWDESIEDFEMIMAARDARIHEDIMLRDGGYSYKITEGGKDFSGGQRQRLEIARVLAQDPTIIILDEATSALDARTEYDVVNSIRDRGITCIVVAHRLSTIRDCDEIIVLDHGVVMERGTHTELMARGGLYTVLVTNE